MLLRTLFRFSLPACAMLGAGAGWLAATPPVMAQTCPRDPLLLEATRITTQDEVIVVGQVPQHPYVVVVPVSSSNDLTLLSRVKACAPSAFLTTSRLGTYIQAGAFENRNFAEALSILLRSQDLDARIIYIQ